ncbi:MAG: T9SS type A sorting domain-containing protein [Bacteroidia bacterium]|nr:T9SS type A sorting domain-containing protein [Bacteroidia bacterium]
MKYQLLFILFCCCGLSSALAQPSAPVAAADVRVHIRSHLADTWEITGSAVLEGIDMRDTDLNVPGMQVYIMENEIDPALSAAVDNIQAPSVPLSDFTAVVTDHQRVSLSWQAEPTRALSLYTIQRSPDGETWEDAGVTSGSSGTHNLLTCTWVDNTPLTGVTYYRLCQENGRINVACSGMLAVEQFSGGHHITQMFPNPLIFGTTILLTLHTPQNVSVRIQNLSGQNLAQVYSRYTSLGDHAIELNMDSLPPGEYRCVIQTGSSLAYRTIRK